MGFKDLFSASKRRENRLERDIRNANNKYKPKDYRQVALNSVMEEARKGNERAVMGLIQRFSVNAEPSTEDENEKAAVCETLIDLGEKTLPALRRGMRTAESVTWLHRVLRNIVGPEQYKKELLDVLLDFDTEYERNPDKKLQTIMALSDVEGEEVVEALLRFLEDVDETVRFQTVSSLVHHADEKAREPMLRVMCEDESLRIRHEIVEAFSQLGWLTTGFKKKVDAILPAGYRHEKSGKIVKLGNA